ncbi:MAG: hypothetical protein RL071_2763 [Pseudomonadota bacterium]
MTAPEPASPPVPWSDPPLAAVVEAVPVLCAALARARAAGRVLARASAEDEVADAAFMYTTACAALGRALLCALAAPATAGAAPSEGPAAQDDKAPGDLNPPDEGGPDVEGHAAGASATHPTGDAWAPRLADEDEDPADLPTAPGGARALLRVGGAVLPTAEAGCAGGAAAPEPVAPPADARTPAEAGVGAPGSASALDTAGLDAARAALAARLKGSPPTRAPRAVVRAAPPVVDFADLLGALGAPVDLTPADAPAAELIRLQRALDGAPVWPTLPDPKHRALVEVFTLRLRVLQDNGGVETDAIDVIFGRLTDHSATHRPGFVHGLARAHTPLFGAWRTDLGRAWTAALRLAEGDDGSGAARAVAKPRPAAAPARTKEKAGAPEATAEGTPSVDPAVRAFCAGKRALLAGAERLDEDILGRLETGLGLDQLEWLSGKKPRPVSAKASALRHGDYPLVIVLKSFMSHRVTDSLVPACRASGTPIAWVDKGYGLTQVAEAVHKAIKGGPVEP